MSEALKIDPSGRPVAAPRLPIGALGMSLGLFLAITFALCAAFDLLVPGLSMAAAWQPLLPGVTRLNAWGLLLGLAETFAYGWYAALVFAPLYNRLAARA